MSLGPNQTPGWISGESSRRRPLWPISPMDQRSRCYRNGSDRSSQRSNMNSRSSADQVEFTRPSTIQISVSYHLPNSVTTFRYSPGKSKRIKSRTGRPCREPHVNLIVSGSFSRRPLLSLTENPVPVPMAANQTLLLLRTFTCHCTLLAHQTKHEMCATLY